NFASRVTLVHRRDHLRAEKILQQRLFAHEKINVIWDHEVEDVLGNHTTPPAVTGVRIRNVKTGATSDLKVDGVFVAIGHAPAVGFLGDQLRLKPSGYLWTEANSTATSIPGVFAAGDVTDETFRQAVTAAGLGCMAALEAERWLAINEVTAEAAE
ncbi:MAG TPA: FAD-dependent oxidoreductase, partial [Bauldia sp.]|nr:FAD-dependent oxidoreductase [Bauldia sp.]